MIKRYKTKIEIRTLIHLLSRRVNLIKPSKHIFCENILYIYKFNNKQIVTGESQDTINFIHYFIQEKIDTYRQLQENEFKHQMNPSKSQCESEYTQLFKRQLKKSSINQTACCNITNKNLRKSEQNTRNYSKFFKFWRTLIQDR